MGEVLYIKDLIESTETGWCNWPGLGSVVKRVPGPDVVLRTRVVVAPGWLRRLVGR